jgi:hypothetical protein
MRERSFRDRRSAGMKLRSIESRLLMTNQAPFALQSQIRTVRSSLCDTDHFWTAAIVRSAVSLGVSSAVAWRRVPSRTSPNSSSRASGELWVWCSHQKAHPSLKECLSYSIFATCCLCTSPLCHPEREVRKMEMTKNLDPSRTRCR